VRFARHLAAALLVVAVVVALGVLWEHSSAASWLGVSPEGPGKALSRPGFAVPIGSKAGLPRSVRATIRPGGHADLRPMQLGLGSMLDSANLPSLIHTVFIEVAVIAAVVVLDAGRRRWRRARRARRAAR
jgi:hypothetical protein